MAYVSVYKCVSVCVCRVLVTDRLLGAWMWNARGTTHLLYLPLGLNREDSQLSWESHFVNRNVEILHWIWNAYFFLSTWSPPTRPNSIHTDCPYTSALSIYTHIYILWESHIYSIYVHASTCCGHTIF